MVCDLSAGVGIVRTILRTVGHAWSQLRLTFLTAEAPVSCMRLLNSGGDGDPIAQPDQAGCILLHVFECELCQRCSGFQERDTAPEQNRDDQHLHKVHLVGLEQAPEQIPTAKKPDVPAGCSAERSDAGASVGSYDSDAWVFLRRQGS